MRWTGLLLAVACTHAQPPPAPLAVPAENAAGPANLPDAGAPDAGAPDGGAPDGGSDGGAPRADLVSPITAADTDVLVELGLGRQRRIDAHRERASCWARSPGADS
ncbi:MAG TPA: hypothetical protein VFA79_01470 [Myxococcales bacterium]|nr:hypothetical protein [Myxococcales bacterium]